MLCHQPVLIRTMLLIGHVFVIASATISQGNNAISILPKFQHYTKDQINITPFVAYNTGDELLAGIVAISKLNEKQNLRWTVAPFYGTQSEKIRGYAEARYSQPIQGGLFDYLLTSFSAHHFGYNQDTHYNFIDAYWRLSPEIAFRIRPELESHHVTQWVKYRFVHAHQLFHVGVNYDEKTFRDEQRNYGIHEISFRRTADNEIESSSVLGQLQGGNGFLRIGLQYKHHFRQSMNGKGAWLQFFLGILPVYKDPPASVRFAFNGQGSNGHFALDFMYDQWLGGRNRNSGLFARQLFPRDAGLKTLATNGISEKWMAGGGGRVSMPFGYLHFYLDGVAYASAITQETEFDYSGGLALVIFKDIFEIYLPLVESNNIRNSLSYVVRDEWHERISFQANIRLCHPMALYDKKYLGL